MNEEKGFANDKKLVENVTENKEVDKDSSIIDARIENFIKKLDKKVGTPTLKECIEMTRKFYDGEISVDDMNEFGSRIVIRAYIPILEKMQLMINVLTTNQLKTGVVNPEIIILELYKEIFFKVILGGYAQIRLGEADYQTYDNYDLLYPMFNNYILSFCKDDFKLFMNMLRDSMSLYGITNVTEAMEQVDTEKMTEVSKQNSDIMDKLRENPEFLDKLMNIAEFANPTTKKVVESLKEIGYQGARNRLKNKDKDKDKNEGKDKVIHLTEIKDSNSEGSNDTQED